MGNKVHIGCDPGKTGGFCLILQDLTVKTYTYPILSDGDYDIKLLFDFFSPLKEFYENLHVVVEDVSALQKPYDRGNWALSRGKAILETICISLNLPHTLVHSKTWQKEMHQGIKEIRKPSKIVEKKNGVKYVKKGEKLTKDMSELAAKKLFPHVDLRDPGRKTDRVIKNHDGVIDALLMAEYSRRKYD